MANRKNGIQQIESDWHIIPFTSSSKYEYFPLGAHVRSKVLAALAGIEIKFIWARRKEQTSRQFKRHNHNLFKRYVDSNVRNSMERERAKRRRKISTKLKSRRLRHLFGKWRCRLSIGHVHRETGIRRCWCQAFSASDNHFFRIARECAFARKWKQMNYSVIPWRYENTTLNGMASRFGMQRKNSTFQLLKPIDVVFYCGECSPRPDLTKYWFWSELASACCVSRYWRNTWVYIDDTPSETTNSISIKIWKQSSQ